MTYFHEDRDKVTALLRGFSENGQNEAWLETFKS